MFKYYLNLIILNLFKISWLTIIFNLNNFFKIITILILVLIFKIILNSLLFRPSSNDVISYYKINNNFEKFFVLFMISLYLIIFIIGIFVLRYINQNRSYDLLDLKARIITEFNSNIINATISCIILMMLIILFLVILLKIIYFFNKYFIKFHLYYYTDDFSKLYPKVFSRLIDISYIKLLNYIQLHTSVLDYKILGFTLYHHLRVIIPKLHYILLCTVLIYDILFNHGVIHIFYKVLLFTYFYHIYIKIINLDSNLDLFYNADMFLNLFLYNGGNLKPLNNEEFYFEKDELMRTYSLKMINLYIQVYLKYGLNGPLLYRVVENNPDLKYPGHYTYF